MASVCQTVGKQSYKCEYKVKQNINKCSGANLLQITSQVNDGVRWWSRVVKTKSLLLTVFEDMKYTFIVEARGVER